MLGKGAIATRHRAMYNAMWLLDHCIGRQRALEPIRARIDAGIRSDLQRKGAGRIRPVDRRRDLSAEDFVRDYLRPNIPVVLEGAAADWGCAKWTPQVLADRYPDDEVLLINASPDDLRAPSFAPGKTTLAAVVAGMDEGSLAYARFNPLLQHHPELIDDLDAGWLLQRANRVRTGVSYQLFMGGGGTATATHNAVSNNLFVQIYGEKRWLLFPPTYTAAFAPPLLRAPYFFSHVEPDSPDHERFPLYRHVDGYEVRLSPGDVLFNPSFYWHWVENLAPTVGVGFRWFAPASIARSSITQFLLTVLATNPPVWTAKRHRQDFSRIFAETKAPSAWGRA